MSPREAKQESCVGLSSLIQELCVSSQQEMSPLSVIHPVTSLPRLYRKQINCSNGGFDWTFCESEQSRARFTAFQWALWRRFIWKHIEMSEIHALNIQQKSVNKPPLLRLNWCESLIKNGLRLQNQQRTYPEGCQQTQWMHLFFEGADRLDFPTMQCATEEKRILTAGNHFKQTWTIVRQLQEHLRRKKSQI